jgi:putative DNA primase/helicase
MAGNEELIKFLQRAYGHCLTGATDERAILIQYGMGGNGKTTSNEVVSLVLGDYAVRTSTETLLVKRYGAIPNDVAKLKGARFVYSSEAEEGRRLSESLIKDLTGGDTIAARFMRGEWFTFKPTFKIWLATNHKPIIRGTDKAIWDRIRLVPYTVTIPDEERIPLREMMAHFMDELPGILSWMVQGCLDWERRGLGMPHEVREATGQYREEMDVIGEFINECCKMSPDGTATANALYNRYLNWCEKRDEKPMSQKQFGRTLGERGFRSERVTRGPDKGKYRWEGISLVRS